MNSHTQKLICLLIIPMYSALVFACKEALAVLPNIEVVTFLLSFAALVFPLSMSLSIALTFNMCEMLLRGISTWVILYFIVWPLIVFIIWLFRKQIKKHLFLFVFINGLWGFTFGSIDALLHLLMYGKATFYAYWLSSLPFDAVHGIATTTVAVILYKPIWHLWEKKLQYYIWFEAEDKYICNKPNYNPKSEIDRKQETL